MRTRQAAVKRCDAMRAASTRSAARGFWPFFSVGILEILLRLGCVAFSAALLFSVTKTGCS